MKNVVLFFLFVSTSFSALAQDAPAKGHAKIIGAVVDSESNQPVEFANIALIDPSTGKPVNGTVCDDKGKFTIDKVAEGNYTISISFIGYETQTIENILVPDRKEELNLGLLKLAYSTKILNEVVVEGQKNLIEERVDRTIYNAENDITTKGGDATDVLKRVPMLSVDMDGNVSLRGSQNIIVLINNKPSTIMASSIADALKQIPADQIKTVEVITSPSAKYDAEGSGGIINIVTKKNVLQGATLNIDAGVGLRGSNLGLNGNYRKEKMGFSIGGFGRSNYNTPGSFSNTQITKDTLGNDVRNDQQADTRNNRLFGNYTLGWDYDINEKNSLAASVRFGVRNGKSYQDNLYTNNTASGSTLRDVVTNDASETVDINLTYTHLYKKPQREFSILALYSRNNRNNDFNNVTKEQDELPHAEGFKNLNDSYNEEFTLQADYQSPIGTNQMIEFGGKDIMRRAVSDYSYFSDPEGDGIYEQSNNTQLSNNLNYDQNVLSSYLSYTLTTKVGYSLKAGGRYEYTNINAYTQTEDNIEIPSYGIFVPSVNLSKKLKTGMVKVAYNRRIQRPSIQYLNPNVQGSNPISITVGNPELRPEYTNNYELSYSTFKKGVSLNLTSFIRNSTGSIQSISDTITIDGKSGIKTTYANIGIENAYGASIFANVNVGKLTLNGGTDIYYSVLNNNQGTKNDGWVISGRAFGSYDLGEGWGIQFFGFARGKRVQLQGSQGSFRMYSLGVKKDLKDKKGSIGIGAENFFTPTLKIKNELTSPTITQNSTNVMHTMSFRVNFSYRIGKMSADAKPRRSKRSINNDDLKDGGDGGGQGDVGGGNNGGGGQTQQRSGGFTPQGGGTQKPVVVAPVDTAAVVAPEGTWEYTIESPQGGSGVLTIIKEGGKLSGKIKNNQFNKESELSSVSLNGNELSFSYEVSFGGNTMVVAVKSIITNDDLSGSIAIGQFGTYPIKAKRSK